MESYQYHKEIELSMNDNTILNLHFKKYDYDIIFAGKNKKKINLCIRGIDSEEEGKISLRINNLKQSVPNFLYTYYYCNDGSKLQNKLKSDGDSSVSFFSKYIITERITNSITTIDFLLKCDVTKVLIQLISALNIAYENERLIHANLCHYNVLIKCFDKEVSVPIYNNSNIIGHIYTKYVPYIFNFKFALNYNSLKKDIVPPNDLYNFLLSLTKLIDYYDDGIVESTLFVLSSFFGLMYDNIDDFYYINKLRENKYSSSYKKNYFIYDKVKPIFNDYRDIMNLIIAQYSNLITFKQ